MRRRTANGLAYSCQVSINGKRGRDGRMAAFILGATAGILTYAEMAQALLKAVSWMTSRRPKELILEARMSGAIPMRAVHGACIKLPGTFGSGAKMGKDSTALQKVDLGLTVNRHFSGRTTV